MRNFIYRIFRIIRVYSEAFIARYSATAFIILIAALVFALLYGIFILAGFWNIFKKAGHKPYKVLIPIYNIYILNEISGSPVICFWLMLLPLVNIFAFLKISLDLCENFGKSKLFGVGMWLFPGIYSLILGFGESECKNPLESEDDDMVYWVKM